MASGILKIINPLKSSSLIASLLLKFSKYSKVINHIKKKRQFVSPGFGNYTYFQLMALIIQENELISESQNLGKLYMRLEKWYLFSQEGKLCLFPVLQF